VALPSKLLRFVVAPVVVSLLGLTVGIMLPWWAWAYTCPSSSCLVFHHDGWPTATTTDSRSLIRQAPPDALIEQMTEPLLAA
jgi:hypothetical protein